MRKLLYIVLGALLVPLCLSASADEETPGKSSPGNDVYRQLVAAADSGNVKAVWQLARVLEKGAEYAPQDTVKALELYRQAADSLFAPALNYLGFLTYNGELGVPQDMAAGIMLIEKAAMMGDPSAAANLGWLLSNSDQVVYDSDKALYWLKKAAESGNYLPLEGIADVYMQRGDTIEAVQAWEEAAVRGSHKAPYMLMELNGNRYEAMGADELMQKALHYYHGGSPLMGLFLFAEAGNKADASQADRALALAVQAQLMSQGYLMEYNHDESLRLFHDAALMGDPSAQFIVAEILDMMPDAFSNVETENEGTESGATEKGGEKFSQYTPDDWRAKAAEQGVTDSKTALARLLP